jgi:antitoxin CptB
VHAVSETRDIAVKRMVMRSWRRGTKEMDMILGPFADEHLDILSVSDIETYDHLLNENDHDLYQWVTRQIAPPERYELLMTRIRADAGI